MKGIKWPPFRPAAREWRGVRQREVEAKRLANDWIGVIDPGLALGQVPGPLEVDPGPELAEPESLQAFDEVADDQCHLEMGAALDAKAFVMESAGQPLLTAVDLGVAVERPPLGIKAFDLVDLDQHGTTLVTTRIRIVVQRARLPADHCERGRDYNEFCRRVQAQYESSG